MSYLTNEEESAIEQAVETADNKNTLNEEFKSVLNIRVPEAKEFKSKAIITIGSTNEEVFEEMVREAKDKLEGLVDSTSKTVNLYEYKSSGDTGLEHDLELHCVIEPENAVGPHHDW